LQKQIWTISKLLAWAIDYFKTKEIPESRLSAELLLSAVLNLSRMDLYLKYDLELEESQLKKYKEFILRRLGHEPIQYITGEAYFRKIKLEVDKSVLIPRPETELVVESAKKAILHLAGVRSSSMKSTEAGANNNDSGVALTDKSQKPQKKSKKIQNKDDSALGSENANSMAQTSDTSPESPGKGQNESEAVKASLGMSKKAQSKKAGAISNSDAANIEKTVLNPNQVINVLEIGIGSGAIALSLLFETDFNADQTFPINVIATDISGDALKTAFKNAGNILSPQKYDHLKLFECDVVPKDNEEFLNKYLKKMDIIISNPPYIAEANYKNLEKQIKNFEPEQALNAGKTGTEQYSRILEKVKPFLNPAASCIIFETDPLTSPELQKIIKSEFKDCRITIEKDYNGMDRILTAFIGN